MNHDPLCPPYMEGATDPCPICAVIAKVRADERAKCPRVEIDAALGEPTTCKVWVGGRLLFNGVDRASDIQRVQE